MAARNKPEQPASKTCEASECSNDFTPKRSTARYCSATCRQRARRTRVAAEHQDREEAKTDTPAEHDLVRAVRQQLATADAEMTVPGQLALQIARRIVDPEASGISTLSKELRTLLLEACGAPTPEEPGPAGAGDDDEDDEVARARRAREAKAAAAAGGA